MTIGAIGASTFTPYIYNTNAVNRASLNKVSGIDDDVTSSKTDFSALTQETTNPLKRGESLDFAGILGMQMQMSRMNASRFIKEPEKSEEATQAAGITEEENVSAMNNSVAAAAQAETSVPEAMTAVEKTAEQQQSVNVFDFAKAMAAYQPIDLFA